LSRPGRSVTLLQNRREEEARPRSAPASDQLGSTPLMR